MAIVMSKNKSLLKLQEAQTKPDLAKLLGLKSHFLTYILYKTDIDSHYKEFEVKKKTGGVRVISAPSPELKDIQRRLSKLLLDCKDAIMVKNDIKKECMLSHGFERHKSIASNAYVHIGKKNVLNIDLEDFFGTINFGRVRGFFIKNRDFQLNPDVATVLAQIACHNNKLPQGSPCSPVIANLITNSLDIKLSKLSKSKGCSYSRYADDITISTRKAEFDKSIVKLVNGDITLGKRLVQEISRSGFSINPKKTRVQFKDSRQDATGLVVNKKVSVKSDYWRTVRAMAHSQFKKGSYETVNKKTGLVMKGSLAELGGKLAFIDSIDRFNNYLKKSHPKPIYELVQHKKSASYRNRLNGREAVYSRFTYYRTFYANEYPTILTEGVTDPIYLKSALYGLRQMYPNLVRRKLLDKTYKPKLLFPEFDSRTKYFWDLDDGAGTFSKFLERFESEFHYFKNQKPKNPVILVLDNDDGVGTLLGKLTNKKYPNCPVKTEDMRNQEFTHIFHNLYMILTPRKKGQAESDIEELFDEKTKAIKLDGKSFSKEPNPENEYGKKPFALKVVRANRDTIDFTNFKPIFDTIEKVKLDFEKRYS